MSGKALSPRLQGQLDRLANMSDDQIYTSDMPGASAGALPSN